MQINVTRTVGKLDRKSRVLDRQRLLDPELNKLKIIRTRVSETLEQHFFFAHKYYRYTSIVILFPSVIAVGKERSRVVAATVKIQGATFEIV